MDMNDTTVSMWMYLSGLSIGLVILLIGLLSPQKDIKKQKNYDKF